MLPMPDRCKDGTVPPDCSIGSSFGSNVYFGQEASLCYLAGFGACRSFQALLFQQLAVCFHFVPISLAAEIAFLCCGTYTEADY